MKARCDFVARPSSTSSRPVANGSSVPGVAGLDARRAPCDGRHHVVGGDPGGLVDQQDAVHAAGLRARGPQATGAAGCPPGSELRCAPTSARRNSISCSSSIAVEKPAARRVAPAPLGAGDHRDVDLVVGGPQRDFSLAGALAAQDLADEHRDLRAPQRPQVVDHALGVAFLGPGGGEVGGGRGRPAPARRRRSAGCGRARSRAGRACRSSCPRTGAGRRPERPRPASISSAAISCARGEVFSYMKRPVSVIRPTYSASAISGVGEKARLVHQLPHDLGRARGAAGPRG